MVEVFSVKPEKEPWLVFKIFYILLVLLLLEVGVFFIASPLLMFIVPNGFKNEFSVILTLIPIGLVIYYLLTEAKSRVESFEFSDAVRKVKITYRSYLNFRFTKTFNYQGLSVFSKRADSFLHDEYDHIEIYSGNQRVAIIGSSATDWHSAPATTDNLKQKIKSVAQEGHNYFDDKF